MEVYRIDDRPVDDGIRDPFRWARFTGPKVLVGMLLVGWVAVLAGGRDPVAKSRGDAIETAGSVIESAIAATRCERPIAAP